MICVFSSWGGAGFVGRNLCAALNASGVDYVTASRRSGVDLRETDETIALLRKEKWNTSKLPRCHVRLLPFLIYFRVGVFAPFVRLLAVFLSFRIQLKDHLFDLDFR